MQCFIEKLLAVHILGNKTKGMLQRTNVSLRISKEIRLMDCFKEQLFDCAKSRKQKTMECI